MTCTGGGIYHVHAMGNWPPPSRDTSRCHSKCSSPVPSRPATSPFAREPVPCTRLHVVGDSHSTLALGLLVALDAWQCSAAVAPARNRQACAPSWPATWTTGAWCLRLAVACVLPPATRRLRRVVAAGLSRQPSASRLTAPRALPPQPRAVPGPHLGRHRGRLWHGRRRRRHLALWQGGLQLAQRPPEPGPGRLLGASALVCRVACVPYLRGRVDRRLGHGVATQRFLTCAGGCARFCRRCASRHPTWAAASRCGAACSARLTAHWSLSAKRCGTMQWPTRNRSDTLCRRIRGMPSRQAR